MNSVGVDGLRSYRLGASNFQTADDIEEDELFSLRERTLRDQAGDVHAIAAEIFPKEGVPLDAPWVKHEFGNVVAEVSDGVAVVVGRKIDNAAVQSVLDLEPRVVVFLEDDLAGKDALKANAFTNARNRGITMKTA
jgi:adenine-specific DNA-methyltransferase